MDDCAVASLVSAMTAFAVGAVITAVRLKDAWPTEPLRSVKTAASARTLIVDGSISAFVFVALARQGVLTPLECDFGDLYNSFNGIIGGLMGSLPLLLASTQAPKPDRGQPLQRVGRTVGHLLFYSAVSEVESRRAEMGGQILSKLSPMQCLEIFPAWVSRRHSRLRDDRDFKAELSELAILNVAGLTEDAIRAEAGSVLLRWLPISVLVRDASTFLGEI